ncbi:MAG: CrcB family protein [Planctomycetes bacterium]|nr:CrcB family protein [Planctomycetota bacterium]
MIFGWLTALLTHPIFLIGVGGAAGANARYGIGLWFRTHPWAKEYFWGTFAINVSGSILLGVVAALFKDRAGVGFLLLGTGFCGGFTTFSTFSLEVAEFIQRDRWDLAMIYVSTSVLAGFLGFAAAFLLTRASS